MLDELRRLVHREVDPKHRDAQGQRTEVVIASPVFALVGIDRLDRAPASRDPVRDLPRARVQGDSCLEPGWRPGPKGPVACTP